VIEKLLDMLNERFDHPNTLVFDEGSLVILGMMLAFLFLGIAGIFIYWPISAIGFVTFIILAVIAWKDFGKFFFEAVKRG